MYSREAYLKPEDLQQKEAATLPVICVDPIRRKMEGIGGGVGE